MASLAYWIVGVFVVGAVIGLVNYAFTPRCETNFPNHLTYQELLQAEAEMVIAIPAQLNGTLQVSAAADMLMELDSVATAAKEVRVDYSISEIPGDMEGSISELLAALGTTNVDALQETSSDISVESSADPDAETDIPEWVLAAEIEASEGIYPVGAIKADELPHESEEGTFALEYELVGQEPPISDTAIPDGYEDIAFRMEDLQESIKLHNAPSDKMPKKKGNVILFPGVMEFFVPDHAPYHIPYVDYHHIHQLYGELADRVTTTPALGPRYAEDVMLGRVMDVCDIVYLEFRGSKIPISKNARSFVGETVFVTGQFVSEQKFLASRIQLAQEAAKARQAV